MVFLGLELDGAAKTHVRLVSGWGGCTHNPGGGGVLKEGSRDRTWLKPNLSCRMVACWMNFDEGFGREYFGEGSDRGKHNERVDGGGTQLSHTRVTQVFCILRTVLIVML